MMVSKVRKNKITLSSLILTLLTLFGFAFQVGCDQSSSKNSDISTPSFSGATRIEAVGDGRWRLFWQPLTDAAETEYLIFDRLEQGGNFDFTLPIARTEDNFFISQDLRLTNSVCFVVRSLIKGESADQNKNEVCTGHQAFAFNGLRELQPLERGNYLISWNLSPYSLDEMSYEVRERTKGTRAWRSVGTTSENFFPSRVININEVVCFNVRYLHSNLPQDRNETEVCTDEENTGNFIGIKDISKATDLRGGYDIKWERSARNDVIGYRVYKGLQMLDIVAETSDMESSYRVTGLGIGATYEFGVRLVTRSGREDGNKKTIRVSVQNDIPIVSKVTLETIERLNAEEKLVKDRLLCSSEFTDPDRSHGKVFPIIEFKARLTTGEKPVLLRERIVGNPVVLDKDGFGKFSAFYTLNPAKDRRGNDLFCEVTIFDGLDPSLTVKSVYVVLPDTTPAATGMFISKKAVFDQDFGTNHYFDAKVGGEAGQILSKVVKGEVITENHACMISGSEGAIQNTKSLDICEDTTIPIIVKKVFVPVSLLEPGKESELNAYRNRIAYEDGKIGDDYNLFYADKTNRAKLGYFDPDESDIASRIEVREAKNGSVVTARCLEGVCTISFKLAKDYNSGSDLGDKQANGAPYAHAQLEYRVRTYEPEDESSCVALDGTPCTELGWSNWATIKIEVTAVDEPPRITGITVKGTEDRVQKVVFCNQRRNDPDHVNPSQVDPDCLTGKTITLNTSFDPTRQDESAKFLAGQGFGYFDLEDDPMVRILPDSPVPPTLGAWVAPVVSNPSPDNRSHWQALQNIPLTASAACDQTSKDTVTGTDNYCPFHCEKDLSKCYGYFMPAVDVYSRIELGYDVWVEVDPITNPDPSFAGLVGREREVRAADPGKIFLDIERVNDPADLANIKEPNWMEDEHDGTPHQIFFRKVNSYLANSVAGAIYVPYYDPDHVRDENNIIVQEKSDMLRRSLDFEVRFLQNGVYKYSYCDHASVPRTSANDHPGTQVSFPNICTLNVGPVPYVPVPPHEEAGTEIEAMAQMRLTCMGNGDCDGDLITPDNYHGALNFQYRIQTTRLDENGEVLLDTSPEGDWSPWKDVELVTSPVADPPRTFTVSLGGQDSYRAEIREDINFSIQMVKGRGIGGYNVVIPGADITEQRFYEGYFDVDETSDIAHTVVVTNVAEYTPGEPVLVDKDGNPLLGDDGLPINSSATGNSTAFQCDSDGACVAEFRSAENFFVPDGEVDPYFEYTIATHPKSISERVEPMIPFKPQRNLGSPANAKGRFSFNIAPVDDAPGVTGAGGIALPEDSPSVFIIGKTPGENELGYSEIEEWNIAEKIEIANIVYFDPLIQPTILDGAGNPNGMGYPDGLANAGIVGAPDIFQPSPIDRGVPGSVTARLLIRGEDFTNRADGSLPFKINENNVDDYIKAAEPANNLPERWQFLCRKNDDPELSAGECWIEVRSPLHFNTGSVSTSDSDSRPDALRVASFDYRIFSRDPELWKPPEDSEDGGSWSEWKNVAVKFDPVNDGPDFTGSLDLSTLSNNGQTGIISAANPWQMFEGTEEYLEFKWGQHYIDADYSTESYTYKEDIAFDTLIPFLPSDLRFGSRFLATKIAVFDMVARTERWNKPNLTSTSEPSCPYGRYTLNENYALICGTSVESEQFKDATISIPTRSFQSSTSRPAVLAAVNDTFTFQHNLNAAWSNFQTWKVYNNSNPFAPVLLNSVQRDQRFAVVAGSTDNNKVVFQRIMAPDAVAGANVKFELGLPYSLVSRTQLGMNTNDTFDFTHTLNVPFAGESSWHVFDLNSGLFLSDSERRNTFEVVDSNNATIRIRKLAPGFGPDFRFDLRFPQHWVQSYQGNFYGLPAADANVTSESNINCDPEGNCRLALALPQNFAGTITASMRLADGSSAPKQKDWTPDSQKKSIFVRSVNVDHLPIMGTEEMMFDMMEDRDFEFLIGMKSNQEILTPEPGRGVYEDFQPVDDKYGSYDVGTTAVQQCGCAGCNMWPAIPQFNIEDTGQWKFPKNFVNPVTGPICYQFQLNYGCVVCSLAYHLTVLADPDGDYPTAFDFQTIPDPSRISFFDAGGGGLVAENRQLHTTPFQYRTNLVNKGQEYFVVRGAPNYYSAKYNNGSLGRLHTEGRPFDYVTSAQGMGSTPWVDENAIEPMGRGDLYFDFKAKTFEGGPDKTNNGSDCSDPAQCWSGVGRVYMRVHPVDDSALALNPISTTIDSAAVNVAKEFVFLEDEMVSLTVTAADYTDEDFNPRPGEGKAIGISSCASGDNAFFKFAAPVDYTVDTENVYLGTRDDPWAMRTSLLKIDEILGGGPMLVSRGRVKQVGGVPQFTSKFDARYHDPALTSSCIITAGASDALGGEPTGTCTMQLRPDANIFGEFLLCVQVRTLAQWGDYINTKDLDSAEIYLKVKILNTDDPPHVGQLAVRARANEDHLADVELGQNKFKWAKTETSMKPEVPNQIITPGYWDLDSSAVMLDTTGLTGPALALALENNAQVEQNYAKYMYVDMTADVGAGFEGIKSGKILYRTDATLSRDNLSHFDAFCSFGNGHQGTNVCRVPCENNGKCFFKFQPAANEPTSAGNGVFSMKWWVSSKGGLELSSRKEDNLAANRQAGGLPGVALAVAAGAASADYLPTEVDANYNLDASFTCLNPATYDLFYWRVAGLEEDETGGIPGVFLNQAFSPVEFPVYSVPRPDSQVPNVLRGKPVTTTADFAKELRLYKSPTLNSGVLFATDQNPCAVIGVANGQLVCGGDDTILEGGYDDPKSRVPCGKMELGKLIILIEPVSDKPVAKDVVRNVSGSQSTLLSFTQSLAPDQDGFSDGDGDKPDRMTFLDPNQLKDGNGDYVGSFSLSPTPPASPVGFALLTLEDYGTVDPSDDKYIIPQEALISAPGCSANMGDCSVYFHPRSGYNGTVVLDFTVSTGGNDSYVWESDRTGPGGPGTLTLNLRSTAPVIQVLGGEPFEVAEDAINGTLMVSGSSAQVSVNIDEGGGIEQDTDEVVVSFESSDHTVIDPTKVLFSRTDGPEGTPTNLGENWGVITITPETDRFNKGTTEVTLTLRAEETGSGLVSTRVFQVKVMPVADDPTIGLAPLPVSSPDNDYAMNEDNVLQISGVFLDEGGGIDENDEELSVTFSVDNPVVHSQIIDPSTDITLALTDESISGNDASPIERTIIITPKPNMYTDSNGIIVTMAVDDNDGAGIPITRSFKVVVNPVNDQPVLTSAQPSGTHLAATNTALSISSVTLDEGGNLDGLGSENDQTLTWEFKVYQPDGTTEDSSIINPATDIALVGTADTDILDSNSLLKTLVITPSGFGLGSIVSLRLSDDGGSTWYDNTFTVDVRKPPTGPITCTPGSGTGLDEHLFGTAQPVNGITCTGLAAAFAPAAGTAYGTDTAFFEIAADPDTTCPTGAGGVNIDPVTGVISGTMPVSDCDLVVSGSDGSVHDTKVPPAQRKLVRLKAAKVSSVSLSNPQVNETCDFSLDVSTVYYLGRSSFQSATAGITGGGLTGALANDSLFSATLSDFSATTSTVDLTIYDNKGTSENDSQVVNISSTPLTAFRFLEPGSSEINLAGLVTEGSQIAYNYGSSCVNRTPCESESLAQIATGANHTCAKNSAGQLYCWGQNHADGRLGLGAGAGSPAIQSTPQHVAVAGSPAFSSVSLGDAHSCLITSAGDLYCFGKNSDGRLGLGDLDAGTTNGPLDYADATVPTASALATATVPATALVKAAAVATGLSHTCYLGAGTVGTTPGAGRVYCAGDNTFDQLGYLTTSLIDSDSNGKSHTFFESAGIEGAAALAAGSNHTCALTGPVGARAIKCWGSNSHNQLGIMGTQASSNFGSEVNAVSAEIVEKAVGIYAGGNSTCLVTSTGSVHCWGANEKGQLGDATIADTDSDEATPVKLSVVPLGLDGTTRKVVSLAMGNAHTCALTSTGHAWCFGDNSSGQLGLGTMIDSNVPAQLTVQTLPGPEDLPVVAVSAGAAHTCLVTQNAQIQCMGKGTEGALGDGQNAINVTEPAEIPAFIPSLRLCKSYLVDF